MERIDTREKNQYPVSFLRDRRFIGATLAVGLLAFGTDAYARPKQIPKPVEEPEPGDSPDTGQEPPDDPDDPPMIPPPGDMPCTEEEDEDGGDDEEDCDPDHPGPKNPNNKPGPAWYADMANRMYYMQDSLELMAAWAGGQGREGRLIDYYATWMKSVVQHYYALGYDDHGKPREYPYGKMTRGGYNYVFYYWVRPIYYNLLYYSAEYYERHEDDPQIPEYQERLRYVADSYHPLVLCNYGFNGDDTGSREDLAMFDDEERAGIR